MLYLSPFSKKVYEVVKKIPKGKVATYGQIARLIGRPRAYRAVGNALHKNPFAPNVPCHRVLNRNGMLAKNFSARGGRDAQQKLLKKEGVIFKKNFQVDLKKCLW